MRPINIVDSSGKLCGIVTDGDIRRHLLHSAGNVLEQPVREIMTRNTTTGPESMAVDTLRLMEERLIDDCLSWTTMASRSASLMFRTCCVQVSCKIARQGTALPEGVPG